MKTRITQLFGIEHPIIGGGMGSISTATLVSAQANAGILGILVSVMHETKEQFRQEIRKTKALTDKPFAVNINLFPSSREIRNEDYIDVALEEEVPIIETAGRSPEPYISLIKQGKAKYMHKCARLRDAIKAELLGADAVEVVGFECGGHPGLDDVTTLVLVPLTVDALSVPVIAGGGFGDGRGLVAALALGAEGVVMGTRFLATVECPIHPNVKEWMLKATESDTTVVQRTIRSNSRVIKNAAAQKCLEMEARGASLQEILSVISGSHNREVAQEGRMDAGTFACGEIVGLIRDIPTVKEAVDRIMRQAEEVKRNLPR
ncbi:MAG: nitronate monooxygenase [Chloroflexi bacterium]|nr:nitronate monooxygenase [Chloroflexota bacterium]